MWDVTGHLVICVFLCEFAKSFCTLMFRQRPYLPLISMRNTHFLPCVSQHSSWYGKHWQDEDPSPKISEYFSDSLPIDSRRGAWLVALDLTQLRWNPLLSALPNRRCRARGNWLREGEREGKRDKRKEKETILGGRMSSPERGRTHAGSEVQR